MPATDFADMQALNCIHPFTYDIVAEREGLGITMSLNSGRKRQDQLKTTDVFPYMTREIPDFVQDSSVIKSKSLIKQRRIYDNTVGNKIDHSRIIRLMTEEIEIEEIKEQPCDFKISQLNILLHQCNEEMKEPI